MNKLALLKASGLMALLLFTTGIALPWIISSVVMPVWMIIFTLIAMAFVWALILEGPFKKLVNLITRTVKNVD